MNNLLFITQSILITMAALLADRLGKTIAIGTICVYVVIANLFVLKQTCLFGMDVTTADVFTIGISLGLNLLQDRYGKQIAQKTVLASLWCVILYTIFSQFQIRYIPSSLDYSDIHFKALLEFAPRIAIASITAYAISQTMDVMTYHYFSTHLGKKFYFMRNLLSIAISQSIDTTLFTWLAFADCGYNLLHLASFSYCIKLSAAALSVTIITIMRKITAR